MNKLKLFQMFETLSTAVHNLSPISIFLNEFFYKHYRLKLKTTAFFNLDTSYLLQVCTTTMATRHSLVLLTPCLTSKMMTKRDGMKWNGNIL